MSGVTNKKCPRCSKRNVKRTKTQGVGGKDVWISELHCTICVKQIQAEERKEERRAATAKAEARVRKAEIPYRDTDNRVQPLLDAIGEVADKGLFLYGTTGTWKSRAACVLLERAIKKGRTGVWVSCPLMLLQYSSSLMDGTSTNILTTLIRPDILVIDDWGKGKLTDRGLELLYTVTNLRFERGLPTWFTANKAPVSLRKWIKSDDADYTGAILRRITEGCRIICTGGKK